MKREGRVLTNANNYFFIIIIYLLYALFITGLPKADILLGGDWSFPVTNSQINQWMDSVSYTWYGLNFGTRNYSSLLPLIYIEKFFTILVSPATFISSLVVLSISFMGINLFALLRFLNINKFSAFLAGICYMSSPIVFEYTVMGWIFILLAMTFLPLAVKYFIKGVQEGEIYNMALVAILLTISFQIHAIVWFLIIAFALSRYLIKEYNAYIYFKYIFAVIFLFALLNAYFLLNLFVLPNQSIVSNYILNSEVSTGAIHFFTPHNIVRLFGGLYNYQYGNIIDQSNLLFFASYFGTLLILFGCFVNQNKKLYLVFLLIFIVPLLFYLLNFNRSLLGHIPFSNVFRDFGRFTVLSSLASGVLIGLCLDGIIKGSKKIQIAGIVMFSIYLISFYPWYSGQLFNWKDGLGKYQVLRTKSFSQDYFNVEDFLLNNKKDAKVLYLPHSSSNDFIDDVKFHGSYQEAQDIFANYSPMANPMIMSDRKPGHGGFLTQLIQKKLSGDFVNFLSLTDINFIVVRKNISFTELPNVLFRLNEGIKNKKLSEVYHGQDILVYKVNEPSPHIYVSAASQDKLKVFENLSDYEFLHWREFEGISFSDLNQAITASPPEEDYKNIAQLFNSKNVKPPDIEYRKINPTKYAVQVASASSSFMLTFLDSFHELWKVYVKPINSSNVKYYETWFYEEVSQKEHFIINGYANSWLINSNDICIKKKVCTYNKDGTYNFDLIIEFFPQKYYYLGLFVTLGAWLVMIFYYLYLRVNNVPSYRKTD